MDYKELIEELRFLSGHVPEDMCDDDGKDVLEKAATALETLLAEREAAIDDLKAYARVCITCCHSESNNEKHTPCQYKDSCLGEYWQWRGSTAK